MQDASLLRQSADRITMEQLEWALHKSWHASTSFCPDQWSEENPARGQCAVTALIVQDHFGGEIQKWQIMNDSFQETDYYNVLPSGDIVALTLPQYPSDIIVVEARVALDGFASVRDKLISNSDTLARYERLRQRVNRQLESIISFGDGEN